MTTALISFPFYAIQYRGPISYLGYLYFLEFLPHFAWGRYRRCLEAQLVCRQRASSFLHEHRTVDVHHNRLMKRYADEMVQEPRPRSRK